MAGVLRISEAASIGLHAMSYLVLRGRGGPVSTDRISEDIGVSAAHLSKVFQRLTRHGLVKSTRGPGGGVILAKNPEDVSLLEIYEAIDGPMSGNYCLMGKHSCEYNMCILGDMIREINETARKRLEETKLSNMSKELGGEKR